MLIVWLLVSFSGFICVKAEFIDTYLSSDLSLSAVCINAEPRLRPLGTTILNYCLYYSFTNLDIQEPAGSFEGSGCRRLK